jgi:tubulin---tyrosine ligase
MAAKGPPRRVLLTNDDGPPSPTESPFIAPFAAAVEAELGWPVQYVGTGQQSRRSVSALPRTTDGRGGGGRHRARVAIPATNCSWIGKAHLSRQAVERTELAVGMHTWTLLTATPASCVNIALFHLQDADTHGPVDLVVSGPNLGRNSGRCGSAHAQRAVRMRTDDRRG